MKKNYSSLLFRFFVIIIFLSFQNFSFAGKESLFYVCLSSLFRNQSPIEIEMQEIKNPTVEKSYLSLLSSDLKHLVSSYFPNREDKIHLGCLVNGDCSQIINGIEINGEDSSDIHSDHLKSLKILTKKEKNSSLKKIMIQNMKDTYEVFDILSKNPLESTMHFQITKSNLTFSSLSLIRKLLTYTFQNLRELKLFDVVLEDKYAREFAIQLGEMRNNNIIKLSLIKVSFDENHIPLLEKFFSQAQNLESFNFSQNPLSRYGISYLIAALSSLPNKKKFSELNLNRCLMSKLACYRILNFLNNNKINLAFLNLSYSKAESGHIYCLMNALNSKPSIFLNLKKINLGGYTAEDLPLAKAIESFAKNCPLLENLDLSDNFASSFTVHTLTEWIPRKANLVALNLRNNYFLLFNEKLIKTLLNSNIRYLDVTNIKIKKIFLQQLLDAANKHKIHIKYTPYEKDNAIPIALFLGNVRYSALGFH